MRPTTHFSAVVSVCQGEQAGEKHPSGWFPGRSLRKPLRDHHPRVAFVLSGGGARAAMHVGALEVLMDFVRPTCIVGASAGALIGLIAILGYGFQEMVDMVMRDLFSPLLRRIPCGNCLNMFRLLRCGDLERRLRQYCPSSLCLESLSPRLAIQCADLVSKRTVLIDRGPVVELVVALCSLPLFGKPYAYENMLLRDSCLMRDNPAPLHEVLGVDLVVMIESASRLQPSRCPKTSLSVPESLTRLWQRETSQGPETASQYDRVIAPIAPSGFFDMNPKHIDQLAKLGRDAARQALPQLAALLHAATAGNGRGSRCVGPSVAERTPFKKGSRNVHTIFKMS